MTPKQRAEMERLSRRVTVLEKRNRALTLTFSKASVDRLIWLVTEIETVCPRPGVRGAIKVTHRDAQLVRPIVEAIVQPAERKAPQ